MPPETTLLVSLSTPPSPFLPDLSNIGRQFIPDWPIIGMELKNLLNGSLFHYSGAYLPGT